MCLNTLVLRGIGYTRALDGSKMCSRSIFKKLKVEDASHPFIPWTCGEDVPLTWDKKELIQMEFKTVKSNYKAGAITTVVYKNLMQYIRSKNK